MELTTSSFWSTFWTLVRMFYSELDDPNLRSYDVPKNEMKNVYDFIVVGAGAAGCVVARRLTENPDWSVLLIEAGRDEDAVSKTPLFHDFLVGSDLDWNYTTVRQTRACLSRDGICRVIRGKVMGGSTAINGMAYARGNIEDYDKWEELGNKGWGFESMLKYFIKSENATEPALANSRYHGTTGPFNVQYPRFRTPLWNEYIKAGEELGLKKRDPNGREQTGIDWMQYALDGPRRESTARAYITPVRNRPNLHVIKKSQVTRVFFDKKRKKAKGVRYTREKRKYTVSAKREVILSAGAIDTPKLLMLSGVGPREELKKHKIELIADLPVGKNLQDHIILPFYFEIKKNVTITSDIWKNNQSLIQYTKYRQGPLTTAGGEALAFYNSLERSHPPNTEIQFYSFFREFERPQYRQIIFFNLFLLDPRSVGTVTLKSSNPLDAPLIDPNFLDDAYDFDSLFKGTKIAFQYMKTPTMAKYSPTLYLETQQLCRDKTQSEYIRCLIRYYSSSGYHYVGTAKMGPEGDSTTVVTSDLMVKGFENLRVIDGSVIPFVLRGNMMAPIIATAEKGSDIIKSHFGSI